jgi:Uma2 family endonuclease
MADTTTGLMTVEEYCRLPLENGEFYYELHHGELVKVCYPKAKHTKTQRRLRQLLEAAAGDAGIVETEIPFRALPEYELRAADVAFVSKQRWEAVDPEAYLQGAPELVIEVLSPSNTVEEILDKEQLCLENGCREFWVLDAKRRQVKVSTPDGLTKTYHEGQEIPLTLFGGGSLKVDAIFAE